MPVLWIIAAFIAFFVKGLCGFANTLVFTSILGFGTNNVNISPVELIIGYPANLIMTLKNRKHLKPSVFIPLILLVIAGSIPAVFLLKNTDSNYLKVLFGIAVILIGAEIFIRESFNLKYKESKIVLTLIGTISGALCGLFGVGALLAAYVGRVTKTADEFKANISAVFIAENTFRIVLYSALGIITSKTIKWALFLFPFVLAGVFFGMKSAKYLNENTAKKLVVILLIISGAIMIYKNI